ncbi:MAG: AAA family ATPase [Parcubacteria group bacterium]|nr:AAA family ATPase [Parcubacteria group bacterium]
MKLLKFKITDFRSIADSGDVELASDVTVLAGKNEAGKTVLLKALETFNRGEETNLDEDDLPMGAEGIEPDITLTFKLEKDDLAELLNGLRLPTGISKEALLATPFSITKHFDNSYTFDSINGSVIDLLLTNKTKKRRQCIEKLSDGFIVLKAAFDEKPIANYPLKDLQKITIQDAEKLRTIFLPQIEAALAQLSVEQQTKGKDFKAKVEAALAEYDLLGKEREENKEKIWELVPNLVYFEAFDKEDALPFEINLTTAKTHTSVKRYCTISGLDLEKLSDTSITTQNKLAHTKKASAVLEGDFKGSWQQDKIDLRVELNGDKLVFAFYEKGKKEPFRMEQRSKGLQWFLAFYLLLKAEAKDYKSIVLIDEPGLFVHAQAQNDILEVLTDLSKENQIVLTTHSPYLIDPARLDRIRLVIKDFDKRKNRGTKVFTLTSDAAADRTTLMPIITAIGLDVTKQLTIAADHNLILEGISDYYYLQAALKFVSASTSKKLEKVHFIPLKGADNTPPIVSLLIGWKLGFHALLDNDDKGKEIKTILQEKLLLTDENISFVSETDGHQVEDLIAKSDFNKFVLEKDESYRSSELNSSVIPDSSKAPLSRQFYEKVSSGQIAVSQETKDNFSKLFSVIAQKAF